MSLPAIANHMATYGRNGDSMLVHMTPSEVAGLQALAEKHGTSLTINPDTGLPEAFSLKSLVPIAAGALLGPAGFGIASSAMGAAAMVGGVTALASGNLKEGLMAGLGAYGGYGLGAGLAGMGAAEAGAGVGTAGVEAGAANTAGAAGASSTAGTGLSTLPESVSSSAEAFGANASGVSPEVAKMQALSGTPASPIMADKIALPQTVTQAPTFSQNFGNATAGFDRLTSPGGLDALNKQMAANSASAMGGPASAMGGLGYSTAGALGMDAMSQKNPAAGAKASPGYIRPYNYDPYGQRYTAQTPVKADEWGSRSFNAADGGIVALAHGGAVQHYDAGGVTDAQIKEYVAAHMDDPAAIAAAAQQYGVSAADLSRATGYSGDQVGSYFSNAGVNFGGSPAPAAAAPATPAYNQFTNEQIGSYLTNNPNADINAAIQQHNADPAAVNRYLANLAAPYKDPTASQNGSGYLGVYQNAISQGIDPREFSTAMQANDPNWGKEYWNQGTVSRAYDVAGKILAFDPLTDEVSPSDKEWVAFMDSNELSVDDISRATGLNTAEVQRRYDAAKEKPVVKPVVPTNGINNTPSRPDVSVATPGDRTINEDKSVTVHPNIPGRPDGGFTGMTGVKDAYTTGGGSLGYAPYAPKTAAEHAQFYDRQTGGSRAAFDYLMGSGAYPTVPSTPTGEIMKPYSEAVLGVPADNTRFAMRFNPVTRKYEANPDYKSFNFNQDTGQTTRGMNQEELAAFVADPKNLEVPTVEAGKGFLGNLVQQLKDGLLDRPVWMAQNNISYEQLAASLGISVAEAKKRYPVNKASEIPADPVTKTDVLEGANGGILSLAGGGMSGYNLGGYSDGGRLLRGPGDGVSDSIPASIGDKQPARLADGEFVVPARIVSELGNGSTEAGARKLYAMMDRVQKARGKTTGKGKVAANSRADKYLPV